ncbi:MAG: hypothetical protein DME45_00275 [Verrucomicrobia bacterium]|nr:MAG: hypothetical protein DME45_00275 [Verrucomicrobiota bacterium]
MLLGSALIQAVKVSANVLTASQKEADDELATQRVAAIEQERLAQQNQPAGESTRRPSAVDQTLKNMRDADAYKAQKGSLETRIASQEAQISGIPKDN